MKQEISLRALMYESLVRNTRDVRPYSLFMQKDMNLSERHFETGRKWSSVEQTSYIESIFLQCTLQPIIIFKNYDHSVIVDGYNRYVTICDFCNNELKLNPKGLKQLKFLKNMTFKDLGEIGEEYFKKCDPIKIIEYSYVGRDDFKKVLNYEEEIEVERYLHVIYNTSIKLMIEDIQRAQFINDCISNLIKDKINSDLNFIEKLETLKLFNGKRKKNKLENILLNCRLLIASTYSKISNFADTLNVGERIEKNYLSNIKDVNPEDIFHDFEVNINQIINNLVNTQLWLNYPILNSKPFFEATYWLISVIRKDKLIDPFKFDFMQYLKYFGEREEKKVNFNVFQSHYRKNIYNKFYVVADFFEKNYGVSMSKYFEKSERKDEEASYISSFEELSKRHFNPKFEEIEVKDLLGDLKIGSIIVRPYYQRDEIINICLSSRIIESLLLGLELPYILVYNYYKNGKYLSEIVDGQQRLLSLIAFLDESFKNEKDELEKSKKNGFALRHLRILNELNNKKFSTNKKEEKLNEKWIKKIYNSKLYISKINQNSDVEFNAIDHFVRLNKNICVIKENTYRIWALTADMNIINYAKNITNEFLCDVLPKNNSKKSSDMITFKLACLNFYSNDGGISYLNYNNKKVTSWLMDFNKFKDKNVIENLEAIKIEREKYLSSFNDIREFYLKIHEFLLKENKSIKDLVCLKNEKYFNIPISNYYYLFVMLNNLTKEDLLEKSSEIYDLIKKFFMEIKVKKLDNVKILKLLDQSVELISVYDLNSKYIFKEKLRVARENL